MKTQKNSKWIYIRDYEVRGIFENRKEAIKYLKEILKQTLKDLDKQDENDNFDYAIKIPLQEFKPVEYRPTHLSLI